MAASKSQGSFLTVFLVGLTVACAGIAYLSTGLGKVIAVVGAAIFLASLFGFLKIKPAEGKPAQKSGAEGMKALGALLAGLGWVVTLVGQHFTTATAGRMVAALVGIAVSLVGIIYVLPAAFNKNAIWKA
jgi:hypothetical protein